MASYLHFGLLLVALAVVAYSHPLSEDGYFYPEDEHHIEKRHFVGPGIGMRPGYGMMRPGYGMVRPGYGMMRPASLEHIVEARSGLSQSNNASQ
ncbi:hypothetical protein D918_07617 [Trichuris suis]|nr:hypothetical protein D918_07617 [Trichuris suis]